MKRQVGITLIALVITIIVLLILAGVSISAITGENGIVEKARDAAEKTEEAEKEEEEKLNNLEKWMDSSLENLEPAEPDPTFPYGTLYSIGDAEVEDTDLEFGIVVYENGVAEMIIIEDTQLIVEEYTGTGQAVVDGNTLTIDVWADVIQIADDYSYLTNGDEVLQRTDTTLDYCAHEWEQTDDADVELHICSKCNIYGIHDLSIQTETTHECVCGLSEEHSYENSVCIECNYTCTHNGGFAAAFIPVDDEKHRLDMICRVCVGLASSTESAHVDSDANGGCDDCGRALNDTSNIITFTIEGTSYQAENGMTWDEWLSSTYNVDDYGKTGAYVIDSTEEYQICSVGDGNGMQTPEDVIVANFAYHHWILGWGGTDWDE